MTEGFARGSRERHGRRWPWGAGWYGALRFKSGHAADVGGGDNRWE